MSDNRALFIEETITGAVKRLLTERVNELLGEMQFVIPLVEFVNYVGGMVVCPVIALSSCERMEKERIICLDAYSLTLTFDVPETADSESHCYAYSAAVGKALAENPTLGGVVDRVSISGKKYVPPKNANCGQEWQVIITLRLTVEGYAYVS
ncbi:MAG: hypothetical protein LBH43_08125 [Treponema sp.]|jgi:hypothetical protein|nr:hypothetical protein [Treponema sp.]